MKATGSRFTEPAVVSDQVEQFTNDACDRISGDDYRIDGKTITLPVRVSDASMLLNGFLVDSKVAQAMIRDSGFRVIELFPGKAILQLLAVDYKENDLGDYNEAAIAFPVLTPGEKKPFPIFGSMMRMVRSQVGSYIYRMPVDQPFTTHAGRFIWGLPKWVSRVDIEFGEEKASGTFIDEEELVFSISAKTGGTRTVKDQRAVSLAIRDGKAWKTWGINSGSGVTFSMGGEMPKIGDSHPLARELKALGLPKKPIFSISMKQTTMDVAGPESVPIGGAFPA